MAETASPTRYNPALAYAVVVDEDGFIFDDEDIDAWADRYEEHLEDDEWVLTDDDGESGNDEHSEPHRVLIVTGTAVPVSQSEDIHDFHRIPENYLAPDVLAEHEVITLPANDVVELYLAARSAAAAHNGS